MKFDGYRALAIKADKEVRLIFMQPALDRNGRSSFHLLQGYGKAQHTPLVYYAFDLLSSDGADLRSQPFIERSKLLAKLLENPPDNIKFSEELTGAKEELEDLIAKRPDSLNEPGRRSGARVKIKLTQQQEFVIGGYAPPEGSRNYFGALLLGYYGPEGLLFAGRVGAGFSERALESLYDGFQKIRRKPIVEGRYQ